MDQGSKGYGTPLRLQPQGAGGHVFHPEFILNDLGSVDHLPPRLFPQDIQNISGITGIGRFQAVAIQKIQGIQNGGGLPGAAAGGATVAAGVGTSIIINMTAGLAMSNPITAITAGTLVGAAVLFEDPTDCTNDQPWF